MSRPVVAGETIPPEEFLKEVKRRARLVGEEAIRRNVAIPAEVTWFIETPDEELRAIPLYQHPTYARLEARVQSWTDML